MKKIVAVVLVVMMSLSMVTGCRGFNGTTNDNDTVTPDTEPLVPNGDTTTVVPKGSVEGSTTTPSTTIPGTTTPNTTSNSTTGTTKK